MIVAIDGTNAPVAEKWRDRDRDAYCAFFRASATAGSAKYFWK